MGDNKEENPSWTSSKNYLLSYLKFLKSIQNIGQGFVLKVFEENTKDISNSAQVPKEVQDLIYKFEDVFIHDIPHGLPHIREVQHVIDLIPSSIIPNHPAYMMNPR